MIWPLAEEVAAAIVANARLEKRDPIEIFRTGSSRNLVYAFAALAHRYQEPSLVAIAKLLGVPHGRVYAFTSFAAENLRRLGNRNWCNVDDLNVVTAALGWPAMTADDMKLYRKGPGRPQRVKDGELTANQQEVFDEIVAVAGPDGVASASQKRIAAKIKRDPSTVGAIIYALVTKRYLELVERGHPHLASRYRIIRYSGVGDFIEGERAPIQIEAPDAPLDLPKFAVRAPGSKAALSDIVDRPSKIVPPASKAPSKTAPPPIVKSLTLGADMPPETAGSGPGFRARSTGGGAVFTTGGLDIRYKPDAPLRGRAGVIIHTEEFCGDPPAHRSALAQRQAEEAERAARSKRE